MIRHLLKLVWHRKRSTGLLMLEIAISFLVVFAVALFGLTLGRNWRQPLGYAWQDVWTVEVNMHVTTDDEWTAEQSTRTKALLAEARGLQRVQAAAGAFVVPYEFSSTNSNVSYKRRSPMTYADEVSDDFAATMGLHLVAGRFFGREDDGAAMEPVVINRRLARALFDDDNPIGKVMERGERELRVVGMVDDFRQFGEVSTSDNYMFQRIRLGDATSRPPRRLLLKVAPGTPASYEQEILARLAPVVPGWSLAVEPLSTLRHSRLRLEMAPLVVMAVVAGFLLLMVGLGLLGVLWQNVTRRTRELGLRRAAGASRAAVQRQVLLELVLITSVAVLPAVLLVVQLPLLSLDLDTRIIPVAVIAALVAIYGLAMLCAFYPSRMATRLAPAEALRWE